MRRARVLAVLAVAPIVLCGCGGGGSRHAVDATPGPTPTSTVAVTATPTPVATAAVDAGALDPAFGDGGGIVIAFERSVGVPRRGLRVSPDGGIEAIVLASDAAGLPATAQVLQIRAEGRGVTVQDLGAVPVGPAAFTADGDVWIVTRSGDAPIITRRARRDDGTFADAGAAPTAIAGPSDLVPLVDGGVVVIGAVDRDRSGIQRFTASGDADAGFGDDGLVLGPPLRHDFTTIFATGDADAAGRILVAGTRYAPFVFLPVVGAYDPDATTDATFGLGGIVRIESIANAGAIAIAPDGGAAVVTDVLGLLRLDRHGVLDHDYAARAAAADLGGIAALSFAADGALTTVGSAWVPDEPRRFDCQNSSGGVCLRIAPVVHRLHSDGAPDERFGVAGGVISDTEPPYGAQGTGFSAFALAPAHRITAAGTLCRAPLVCDVVVARFGG